MNGGVYRDKQWSDKLTFKRISWYQEASMEYDLMLHKLDESSNFANWMGQDKSYLKECKDFYVALIYADFNARHLVSFLENQFEEQGIKKVIINTFRENIRAHSNFSDWRLSQYKVEGFCRSEGANEELFISVPGFQSIKPQL
jgi:uncharacterized protein YozE (UPF0346 family)